MKDDNSITWLLIALAAVGFSLWHQSVTQELQTKLQNCQTQFESFKDGVTYGR
jgi:hypothetical protein